jgi:hypothetical protein
MPLTRQLMMMNHQLYLLRIAFLVLTFCARRKRYNPFSD